MGWKSFTEEEILELKSNKYTHTVSASTISFTAEFKEKFWAMYKTGYKPKQILGQLGYNPDILGHNRIGGIRAHIREQALSAEGFHEGRREHYLFFRLQEMHHNDVLRMETKEIEIPEDGKKISNPIYWMEKQANRGAYGLMMPVRFMRGLMAEKCRTLKPYAHEGEKYEQIGLAIAKELCLPHFRVRARMIQLGHIHARGCLNYVDRRRIQPYSFDEDSLRKDEHCFNIDMRTAGHLYEKNTDLE